MLEFVVIHLKKPQIQLFRVLRSSTTDLAQHVDQTRTLHESKPLAFKALYASC